MSVHNSPLNPSQIVGAYKFHGEPPTLALYTSLTALQARVLQLTADTEPPRTLDYLKYCPIRHANTPVGRKTWIIVYQKPTT